MEPIEQTPTKCLQLTPRWEQPKLRYHPVQSRLFHDRKRFKIAKAGRRSGKTENAKRKLVLEQWAMCPLNPTRAAVNWSDPRWFAGAPTRDQAKAIWWDDLKRLTPAEWILRVYETDLCIRTKWNTELWVVGLDKPQRIEGRSWDGGMIDEFANCHPGMLDANIRPALADRLGWLWLLGVPDADSPGQIDYKDIHDYAMRGEDPDWGVYTWPSSDIIPPEEIAAMKRTMDPRMYQQECGGEFVLDGGRAFPDFSFDVHCRDDFAAYDPALPICWSLDFNVRPFCTGVLQYDTRGTIRVIDTVELADDAITSLIVDAFLSRAKAKGWRLDGMEIHGDPAGNQRNTKAEHPGETDWTIVRNKMRGIDYSYRVRASHASLPDTRNAVNAKLRAADGSVQMFIHSQCKGLIRDLETTLWPSDMKENHRIAWLRYFTHRNFPVMTETPEGEFQVGTV